MIPWTVELRDHRQAGTAPQPAIAFVGGYRHPPNVDAAKWAAQNADAAATREEVPGIELLLVGSHMPAEVSALAAKDVVPLGYVPSLDSVFDRVRLTDRAVALRRRAEGQGARKHGRRRSLRNDDGRRRGADLPDDLSSLVVDEPEQFVSRIEALCKDDAEYQRLRGACRTYIASHYSAERIDTMLREACRLERLDSARRG